MKPTTSPPSVATHAACDVSAGRLFTLEAALATASGCVLARRSITRPWS